MIRIILIILLTGVTNLVAAQSDKQDYVLLLSKKKFEWLIKKQYDSLESVLDDQLMYIHSNGWIESKTEVLDDIKTGKLVYYNVEILDSNVRLFEASAIVTGTGDFSVSMEGKPYKVKLLYTEVYILKDSHWKLASRHANKL